MDEAALSEHLKSTSAVADHTVAVVLLLRRMDLEEEEAAAAAPFRGEADDTAAVCWSDHPWPWSHRHRHRIINNTIRSYEVLYEVDILSWKHYTKVESNLRYWLHEHRGKNR